MIINFRNKGSQDIAYAIQSKEARKVLPVDLHKKARRLLAVLDAARSMEGLLSPGLRLEKLSGNRKGQWSIRINDKYRLCFKWDDGNALDVELVDYH